MNKHLTTVVIVLIAFGTTAITISSAPSLYAPITFGCFTCRVPIAISGDNTYLAWWTNKTGNDEVMFRASADGGATFADKINLSNTTDAESQDVQIAAEGDNVIVTWWERNQTAEEPVVRISTDNGATFGPLLMLSTNGTIGGG